MFVVNEWHICADTGGTFTDVFGIAPDGAARRTKVLSSACLRTGVAEVVGRRLTILADWNLPNGFFAGWELQLVGTRKRAHIQDYNADWRTLTIDQEGFCATDALLELGTGEPAPILGARMLTRTPGCKPLPPHSLRLATTRGTNALLERKVARTCLFVNEGFADLLFIGDQRRPELFALDIHKPKPLYHEVIEVPGRLTAQGKELHPIQLDGTFYDKVKAVRERGCESAAVALLHSYINPGHERVIKGALHEAGFNYVALSSDLAPMIKVLPRAQTSVADAALGPIMEAYLDAMSQSLSGGRLLVMTSAGGLVPRANFRPKDSLLSGPAGGVVGASACGKRAGRTRVISFDMGGTSTDVSRCEEDFAYRPQHTVGDATIVAPALPIVTVAAGGGSICGYDGRTLFVGPESAGANPGPACYGAGGPLTLTDVHLLLGRLRPEAFVIPVFPEKAEAALNEVAQASGVSREALLPGFLKIANERMAEAIRKISVREGCDSADYALLSFGGAGGLHACSLADLLGISEVIVPADAGILSAYGLHCAVVERIAAEQILCQWHDTEKDLAGAFCALEKQAGTALRGEGFAPDELITRQRTLRLRYEGQESDLEIGWEQGEDIPAAFAQRYAEVFGYVPEGRVLEVVSAQVVVSTRPATLAEECFAENNTAGKQPLLSNRVYSGDAWRKASVIDRRKLESGTGILGPAILSDAFSALVLEAGWRCVSGSEGTLKLKRVKNVSSGKDIADETVRRELFTNRFRGIVEEMGEQLRRTALSTNVKERMDYSCALLDSEGKLIANAPHIPVHLGAMGLCVRRVAETLSLAPGDVAVTNHPGFGGSHLPDVTVITPVHDETGQRLGYVANRAHHAEIGGKRPGSMPSDARCLAEEGVVIPPMKLFEKGEARWEALEEILSGGEYPSRSANENLADLRAQVAANRRGATALRMLCSTHGADSVLYYMKALTALARDAAKDALRSNYLEDKPVTQKLDDGTCIKAVIHKKLERTALDFTGSSPRHPANFNATPAIVNSALLYVLRLLLKEDLPLNDGLLEAIDIRLPECFLNPCFTKDARESPAVVAGNVETSQRLVDTLMQLFGLAACSQGTMNNLVFGDSNKSYYETICGGAGAGQGFAGQSCVHTHMTNTAITDPEILERRYPVRLWRFAQRRGSGGAGQFPGGDGVVRELEFLAPMSVSLLTQHRKVTPYGMHGGGPGKCGRQWIASSGETNLLEPSVSFEAKAGDKLIIETPGGGAWGRLYLKAAPHSERG